MIDASRHDSVFNPVAWGQRRVDVIGVGATGSKVALSLAKLGVQNLHVWDMDVVEEHNLANQAYTIADVGKLKVDAIAEHIRAATETVVTKHGEWQSKAPVGEVVFALVDSMAARKGIFDSYRYSAATSLVLDSRMGADTAHLLAYQPLNRPTLDAYAATLFSDDDAHVEVSACGTAITVGPTADIISGYLVWAFIRHAAQQAFIPEMGVGAREPSLVVI